MFGHVLVKTRQPRLLGLFGREGHPEAVARQRDDFISGEPTLHSVLVFVEEACTEKSRVVTAQRHVESTSQECSQRMLFFCANRSRHAIARRTAVDSHAPTGD